MKQAVFIKSIHFDTPNHIIKDHLTTDKHHKLIRLRKTSYRDTPQSPFRNPEEALRIHNAIEKRQLCRSEIGKRSMSIARERQNDQYQKIAKSHSISRYDTRTEGTQESEMATPSKSALHKSITSSKLFATSPQVHNMRRNTEPQPSVNLKEELMRRISKKIDFMKKMTAEEDEPVPCHNQSLFKFDKFYDHCLKNINKCLNHYEKDPKKEKSKKYFQLKIEGGILSKELMEIRQGIVQKRQKEGKKEESGFGIIGSNIDVKNLEKTHTLRNNEQLFRKKAKVSRRAEQEFSNPFLLKQMCGWEISGQKMEELLL